MAAEHPGVWIGGLAAKLGLTEAVTLEQLLNLLDGRHPLTGERLVPFRKDRVAAHDLTFSAPKSVSAVWALAADDLRDAVQLAQDDAVTETLRYIEHFVPIVRRGEGGSVVETAASLLSVAFAHHTARQTAVQTGLGLPPDPQVHTHVLLPMAERRDGRIVAINSSALFRGRREIPAVYHAALAARLALLGFGIDRMTGKGGHYGEVSGVPGSLVKDWSGRHAEIEAASGEWSAEFRAKNGREPTLVELREIAIRHRQAKGRAHHSPAEFWRDVGSAHGVTAATIEAIRDGSLVHPLAGKTVVTHELLSAEGLTREHAAVDTPTLRIAAMERGTGLLRVGDVMTTVNGLVDDKSVVRTEQGQWTTREMLSIEAQVLDWAEQMHAAPVPLPPAKAQLWQALRTHQRRGMKLSGEQMSALNSMLTSRFTAVTGEAGVGKGVVLGAAAAVWHQQERRVFAIAVAGATAQRLAADLPGAEQMTMDGLIARVKGGSLRLQPTDVVAIDEAGMVDSRRWRAFVRAVGAVPQVVALGDDAQLSPLTAGGLWAHLADGGPRLQEVRRTKLRWERQAWRHLRDGKASEALGLYADHGHLSLSETRQEALALAVDAWDEDGRTGLIVTDASNAERHAVNAMAQGRRTDLGESAIAHTDEGEVALHVRDPVIFRRQWRPDGARVENGTTAVVIAIADGTVTVRTIEQEPRELVVPLEDDSLIDLAYASHVYKAQGATVERAYIVAGGWQTHKESLYVAASRSRNGTKVFTDRESLGRDIDEQAIAEMARRAAVSQAKRAATPRRRRRSAASGRPLVTVYQQRQALRDARSAGLNRKGPPTYKPVRHDTKAKRLSKAARTTIG